MYKWRERLAKLRMLVEETEHDVVSSLPPRETVAVRGLFTLISERPYQEDDHPFYIVRLTDTPFRIEADTRHAGLVHEAGVWTNGLIRAPTAADGSPSPWGPFTIGDEVAIGALYYDVDGENKYALWSADWGDRVDAGHVQLPEGVERWAGFPYIAFETSAIISCNIPMVQQSLESVQEDRARGLVGNRVKGRPAPLPFYTLDPEDEETLLYSMDGR